MKALLLDESIELAEKAKIPFVKGFAVETEKELLTAKVKYPVVLKAISPKILHKTEFKAVRIGIKNKEEAVNEFRQLKKLPRCKKVLVQEMIKGTELIVGIKKDSVFGPTILIGFGGIYTELLKDFSLRIAPVSEQEVQEMLEELKLFKILKGFRGSPKANLKSVKNFILKVSKFSIDNPEIMEADFNPVIVNKEKAAAVDARIVVE